jgi:hypothetical protein
MGPLTATIIGIMGSILIVGAYGYTNIANPVRPLPYNIINLAGAALLTVSLTVHFNLASLLLEFVWMAIALYGIFKAIGKKGDQG